MRFHNNSVNKPADEVTQRKLFSVMFFQVFESFGALGMLIIIIIITYIITPNFLTAVNLGNLVIAASIMAIGGFGMTFAIAMGAFDLSIGSTQALTACIVANLLTVFPIPLAIVITLMAGLLIGIVNGFIITKLRVPALVATLGMMSIIRGIALLYTNGQSILILGNDRYSVLNTGRVLGVPVPFVIALVTLGVLYILLQHTPFGRHVCAVGGNRAAAIAVGLNVDRITLAVFGLVGTMAALSGVMLSSQLMRVDATLGTGFELKVITITVLGGTSFSGGIGNIPGTLFGALLLAAISSALNILKVPAFYQYLATGVVLIFALTLDTIKHKLVDQAKRVS